MGQLEKAGPLQSQSECLPSHVGCFCVLCALMEYKRWFLSHTCSPAPLCLRTTPHPSLFLCFKSAGMCSSVCACFFFFSHKQQMWLIRFVCGDDLHSVPTSSCRCLSGAAVVQVLCTQWRNAQCSYDGLGCDWLQGHLQAKKKKWFHLLKSRTLLIRLKKV